MTGHKEVLSIHIGENESAKTNTYCGSVVNIKEENFIIINNENKLLIEEFMDGIVINAKNEFALSSSIEQLNGRVSEKIKSLRKKIIYNIAFIESALDDPEHISIDGYSDKDRLDLRVSELRAQIANSTSDFDREKLEEMIASGEAPWMVW